MEYGMGHSCITIACGSPPGKQQRSGREAEPAVGQSVPGLPAGVVGSGSRLLGDGLVPGCTQAAHCEAGDATADFTHLRAGHVSPAQGSPRLQDCGLPESGTGSGAEEHTQDYDPANCVLPPNRLPKVWPKPSSHRTKQRVPTQVYGLRWTTGETTIEKNKKRGGITGRKVLPRVQHCHHPPITTASLETQCNPHLCPPKLTAPAKKVLPNADRENGWPPLRLATNTFRQDEGVVNYPASEEPRPQPSQQLPPPHPTTPPRS
ncbi:unnamed protein product [Pleuronectes platessa]|uniref:Uncharacterized protein n=1 Tax=Pleuronectes platessa TaxID=8262 RepID=A0A9N7V6T3_PLEPL|nr:unnamed protein product [Pleuronectes platessa]